MGGVYLELNTTFQKWKKENKGDVTDAQEGVFVCGEGGGADPVLTLPPSQYCKKHFFFSFFLLFADEQQSGGASVSDTGFHHTGAF